MYRRDPAVDLVGPLWGPFAKSNGCDSCGMLWPWLGPFAGWLSLSLHSVFIAYVVLGYLHFLQKFVISAASKVIFFLVTFLKLREVA